MALRLSSMSIESKRNMNKTVEVEPLGEAEAASSSVVSGINNTHVLSGRWSLWYHDITEESWELTSYKKLYHINTLEDYIVLHNTIPTFTSGMFIVMREGYSPRREDMDHANGGFWSFKIPKKFANQIWEEVVGRTIGNTMTKRVEDSEEIIGLSISPKINNCIIKIWNRNKNRADPNMLVSSVRYINPEQAMYKILHQSD
jgi:hypothetical protein